jgi:cell division inhibitor SulA
MTMNSSPKLHHLNACDRRRTRQLAVIPAGIPELEALLPAGGLPKHGLVEVLVPDEHTDALSLFLPVLARLSQQERWLGMVVPPYRARARVLSDTSVDAMRIQQINPHKGRSGLWTLESLLRSGNFSVVMAWPGCATELMAKRLEKAAGIGRSLGILFRVERQTGTASRIGLRLQLEADAAGRAVYLLDEQGNRLSGAAPV